MDKTWLGLGVLVVGALVPWACGGGETPGLGGGGSGGSASSSSSIASSTVASTGSSSGGIAACDAPFDPPSHGQCWQFPGPDHGTGNTSSSAGSGGNGGGGANTGGAGTGGGGGAGNGGAGTGGAGTGGAGTGGAGTGGAGTGGASASSTGSGGPSCNLSHTECGNCLMQHCCAEVAACQDTPNCLDCISNPIPVCTETVALASTIDFFEACAIDRCPSECSAMLSHTCNPITAAGCSAGDGCDLSNVGFSCFPAGTAQVCEECNPSGGLGPACAAGMHCVTDSFGDSTCARYCCFDGDCGTGRCDLTVLNTLIVGVCVK